MLYISNTVIMELQNTESTDNLSGWRGELEHLATFRQPYKCLLEKKGDRGDLTLPAKFCTMSLLPFVTKLEKAVFFNSFHYVRLTLIRIYQS